MACEHPMDWQTLVWMAADHGARSPVSCGLVCSLCYCRERVQFALQNDGEKQSPPCTYCCFLIQEIKSSARNKVFSCGASLLSCLLCFWAVMFHWCLEFLYICSIQIRNHISVNLTNSQVGKYMPTPQNICTYGDRDRFKRLIKCSSIKVENG